MFELRSDSYNLIEIKNRYKRLFFIKTIIASNFVAPLVLSDQIKNELPGGRS